MRQTNVCLNRVFKVYVNFLYPGAHANFCAREKSVCCKSKERKKELAKKVCDVNRTKERKKEREKNNGRFIQGDQGDESAIKKY